MIQCGIHERDGFPQIFQKESTLYGDNYYEKEEVRPYSYAQVNVQKIREMDRKEVDS